MKAIDKTKITGEARRLTNRASVVCEIAERIDVRTKARTFNDDAIPLPHNDLYDFTELRDFALDFEEGALDVWVYSSADEMDLLTQVRVDIHAGRVAAVTA